MPDEEFAKPRSWPNLLAKLLSEMAKGLPQHVESLPIYRGHFPKIPESTHFLPEYLIDRAKV
jgi:hypothetical protein